MSKTCHECENCIYTPMCDNTLCPISDEHFAEMCGGFTQIQKPPKTVFETITASPEVLAGKLVYQRNSKVIHQNDKRTLEYWTFSWKSSVIKGQSFETREEAIAATVARLKEVEK